MIETKKNMTFDEAYAALEKTIRAMEAPNLTFEENLELYEYSCKLVIYCRRLLERSRAQMDDVNKRMRKLLDSGAPIPELED